LGMNTFNEKIIIITGAGSGIGKGLAEAFALQNATLILCDINEDSVKTLAQNIINQGGKAEAFHLDVCNQVRTQEIWQQIANQYGRLDYVFNNAGYGMAEEVQDIPYEQWHKMVDVNLMGVVYGAVEAFKIMKDHGGGHIINVASLAGLIGSPGSIPYSTTKYAVVGLSKSMRVEGAAFNIKVSALCPGFIDTGIYENAWTGSISNKLFKKTIPLPIIPISEAIPAILKGVEKNEQLIILPKYAKTLYWMARIFPSRLEGKQIGGMKKFRRLKEKILGS
jgi:NAD(P)-dependent dehydrogenase (short-subunit alcohol dehydrogenase family)